MLNPAAGDINTGLCEEMPMEQTFSQRTILITGASSGLGRAAAIALAARGARLLLWGRDQERLAETRAMLAPGEHLTSALALEDADLIADAVKEAGTSAGGLDGIFHSAGRELVRPVRLTKATQVAELVGPGLLAPLGIARAAASKGVLADGASLVFMSSVAGQRGTAGMVAYSAVKSAMDGFVKSLACELAPRRIRVNAIAAGAVETEMHTRLEATLGSDGVDAYRAKHLLGFGMPDDITAAAAFLLGPDARWITGTTLIVDGGYSVR